MLIKGNNKKVAKKNRTFQSKMTDSITYRNQKFPPNPKGN
jgi:hypothetical protein